MTRALQLLAVLGAFAPLARAEGLEEILDKYNQEDKFQGVALVARGESVLLHKALGPAEFVWETPLTPDARFPICNLTETFTAVLALRQVEKGALRLDQTVGDFWPSLKETLAGTVTLEQIMMRKSGLANVEHIGPDISPAVAVVPDDVSWFWRTRDPRIGDLQKSAELMLSRKPVSSPGFGRVNPTDYIVLGAILEKVTEKPFAELLETEIIAPLGLQDTMVLNSTKFVPKLASSALRAVGGLHPGPSIRWENSQSGMGLASSARDLHRWAMAVMEGKLLNPASTKKLFGYDDQFLSPFGTSMPVPFGDSRHETVELLGAVGAYRIQLSMLPEQKIVVILLSGSNNFNPKPISRQANLPYELATAALANKSVAQ
ncbi:MAG: serine hydrolase domain-containing protein [Fimbriimonadaceae bacterium]